MSAEQPEPSQTGAPSLVSPHSSVNRTERRSFPRHPLEHKTLCQAAVAPKDEVWILGRSRDISLAGIGLLLHRRFEPGTLLAVDLEEPGAKTWLNFQVRVQHLTQQTDRFWVLGCAFLQHLREGQLQAWLATSSLSPVSS